MEVTEKLEGGNSEARSYQASLWEILAEENTLIQMVTQILEELEEFC